MSERGGSKDQASETSSGLLPRLLKSLGLNRPELRAWAMYDWANSAMICTIVTAVFPTYFSKVACAGLAPEVASRRLAIATTIGMTIIAVISPILGAYADYTAKKKKLLALFMMIGLLSVAAMFFIYHGDWLLASLLFILANIGANGSFVFYDALLPHIARDDEIDRVSTAGYAIGYLGGGVLLALNLAWIMKPALFGLPSGPNLTEAQATLPTRLAFLSVAIWWLVFAIPLFLRVREPAALVDADEARSGSPIRATFARLAETARDLRSYRQGFLMLLAFLIYNDGIGTIIRMSTIYGQEIGLETEGLITAILIVQFVGIPCSFLFGSLAGQFGVKRTILIGLIVYTGICVLGFAMTTSTHFLILAILVGFVQGGTQALSRSLFASMIPKSRSGEFFGFFAVVEKFAGIIGPALFWLINLMTGSSRGAILAIIGFFAVGGALLWMVNVEEGQREAAQGELKLQDEARLLAGASTSGSA